MKKAVTLALACVLSLCLLLSGCSGGGLGGLTDVFGSRSPDSSGDPGPGNSGSSGSSSNPGGSSNPDGFSIDLSQGKYTEGDEDGYLGDVLHTYWFNFAADSAYTCKTYGGYTAPDGWRLLVVRLGLKNTYGSSFEMYDTDFQLWWNDDADDAYAWPVTTSTDIDDDQVHVDAPLSDEMFPETYLLGINETRVGELIFQVPAIDPNGRENRDFVLNFVELFDTDNEDDQIGDYYFIDFTAEARSPLTDADRTSAAPSPAPSQAPSAQPSPEPSVPAAQPSPEPSPAASGTIESRAPVYFTAADDFPSWDVLSEEGYVEGSSDSGCLGDVLHTRWFNFAVGGAYLLDSYNDYTPPAGQQLLVMRIYMKNTTGSELPMNDQDFVLLWGDGDDSSAVFALTTGEEVEGVQPHIDAPISDIQLPEYYDIPADTIAAGELIFQVPAGHTDVADFSLIFTEYFTNGEEGDSYLVSLSEAQ